MKSGLAGDATQEQECFEDAITRLRGIVASQVVLDQDGRLQEVHAIGTKERSAKQTVRDIETLLRVRFGQTIDYRKISLVQLDEGAASEMLARPQLCGVEGETVGDAYQVSVNVQLGDAQCRAMARGEDALAERLRTAATATLQALAQLVHKEGQLSLGDAQLLTLSGKEVVAVAVTAWFPTGNEEFVGLSIVRRDQEMTSEMLVAAARASLGALNRRLPLILGEGA